MALVTPCSQQGAPASVFFAHPQCAQSIPKVASGAKTTTRKQKEGRPHHPHESLLFKKPFQKSHVPLLWHLLDRS